MLAVPITQLPCAQCDRRADVVLVNVLVQTTDGRILHVNQVLPCECVVTVTDELGVPQPFERWRIELLQLGATA